MTDPIQSSSSIPIPPYQTQMGSTDPTVDGSARSTAALQANATARNQENGEADFQAYLNQQQILHLQKPTSGAFDPAAEITKDSPYGTGPGGLP